MTPNDPPNRASTPKVPVDGAGQPAVPTSKGDSTAAANQLTAEEQMALFEKELKENDWGHQPC